MNIYYSDEQSRLDDEIISLMQRAADYALESEFEDELDESCPDIGDIPVNLSVSVVDGDIIQELNRDYRGIDKVTDVLSFPQFADSDELLAELSCFELEGDGGKATVYATEYDGNADVFMSDDGGVLLGDVVICYDRALEQAEEYGTGIRRELVYLFVHSIFHLFGYDHMVEDERTEMRAREEAVLSAINLSR